MPEPSAREVAWQWTLAAGVPMTPAQFDALGITLTAYAEQAVAQEREAIAAMVDALVEPPGGAIDTGKIWRNGMALTIADKIRQRATPPPGESGGA